MAMNFNPADMFKIKGAFDTFNRNHPKLMPFFKAVGPKAMQPGSVIEIAVTDVNGEKIETNLRVQESDIELINMLVNMSSYYSRNND